MRPIPNLNSTMNIAIAFLSMVQFQLVKNVFADQSIYVNCFCTTYLPFYPDAPFFFLSLTSINLSKQSQWSHTFAWIVGNAFAIKLKCANAANRTKKTYLGLHIVECNFRQKKTFQPLHLDIFIHLRFFSISFELEMRS